MFCFPLIHRQHTRPDVKSSAQRVHDLLIPPAGTTRYALVQLYSHYVAPVGSTIAESMLMLVQVMSRS